MSGMSVLAIDPGTEQSAYVVFDGERVEEGCILSNEMLLSSLECRSVRGLPWDQHLAIEMVASYGMPVGREVFETVFWTGRFCESWDSQGHWDRIYRQDVKLHLCQSPRAKDANIRQALIDRFGPGKDKAIGRKASPGPLYGLKSHMWAALAVAVTWWDLHRDK